MNWTRLYKQLKNDCNIKVVSSCILYRKFAKLLPTAHESVLEIGCSTGLTTQFLIKSAANVVAVDTSYSMTEQTKQLLNSANNLKVLHIDGRDVETIKSYLAEPDLIFMDIGGDIILNNLISLLRIYLFHFQPRIWIVRSFELSIFYHMIVEAELPNENAKLKKITTSSTFENYLESLLALSKSEISSDRIFAARKLYVLSNPIAQQRIIEMQNDPHAKVRKICRREKSLP